MQVCSSTNLTFQGLIPFCNLVMKYLIFHFGTMTDTVQ